MLALDPIHVDQKVFDALVELGLNGCRQEALDVPTHCNGKRGLWRLYDAWIFAYHSCLIGVIHEDEVVVESICVEMDVLEQLVRRDCSVDIRSVRVCGPRRFGSDEEDTRKKARRERGDDENENFENEEEEQELYSNDKVGADVASFLHVSLKRTETDNPRLPVQRVLLVK